MNRFNTFQTALQLTAITVLTLAGASPSYAKKQQDLQLTPPVSPNKTIRFYKVNKQLQGDRVMLTDKKAATPGCQNFLKSVRVYRAIQTGFTVCLLYAEKDCEPGSIVGVAREKDPRKTSLMTEGIAWLPQSEEPRGVKISSWNCGDEVEAEQFAYEFELATSEVRRLKLIAKDAEEKAALAQSKASKAQKTATKAVEHAALAKRRAIAAGVVIPKQQVASDAVETETADDIEENGETDKSANAD